MLQRDGDTLTRNSGLGTRNSAAILAFIAVLSTVSTLSAHIMPDGQGSARLVGNRAYILVTVPTAVLHGADDDKNGLLNDAELRAHVGALKEQILTLVRFDNGSSAGRTLYHEVLIPHVDSSAGVETAGLTVMRIEEWDSTVTQLGLHADVFSSRAPPEAKQLVFRAIRGDSTEVAILSASKTAHGFFGAQVAASDGDAWQAFVGLALIVGLFVAYFLQRRAKAEPMPVTPAMAEELAGAVPMPRGSSPNWGAPILFCGFLYGASNTGSAWSALWHLLFFALVALGAYTSLSAKEFAGELTRDPATTRREHSLKFGVPYVIVPLLAWVLVIVVGWPAALLLPAVPWALLLVVGLVVAVLPRRA